MPPHILSVDLGHGHTKLVHRPAPHALRRESFPSLALPSPAEGVRKNSITKGLQVMNVEVDGARFLVGKDIDLFAGAGAERNRSDAYSTSAPYLALMRGALSKAALAHIDLLVVGLPLTTLDSNSERLRQRLIGTHEVPPFMDSVTRTEKTQVTVRDVVVLAQPLGALLSALASDHSLQSARILTFDMGFNTLDLITSMGVRPYPGRSGAVQGGVASYIDALQESVEQEVRANNPSISGQYRVPAYIYEEALKLAPPHRVSLSVGEIPLGVHHQNARARLEQEVEKAIAMVGNAADITAFVLAGGGANLLLPVLQKMFPEMRKIEVTEEPQFAVARGYFFYGEKLLQQGTVRAA